MRQHQSAGVRAVILMVDQPAARPEPAVTPVPVYVDVFESGFGQTQATGTGSNSIQTRSDQRLAGRLFLGRRRRLEERHPRAQLRADLFDLMIALPLAFRLEPPVLRFARQLFRVRA